MNPPSTMCGADNEACSKVNRKAQDLMMIIEINLPFNQDERQCNCF